MDSSASYALQLPAEAINMTSEVSFKPVNFSVPHPQTFLGTSEGGPEAAARPGADFLPPASRMAFAEGLSRCFRLNTCSKRTQTWVVWRWCGGSSDALTKPWCLETVLGAGSWEELSSPVAGHSTVDCPGMIGQRGPSPWSWDPHVPVKSPAAPMLAIGSMGVA